MSGSFMHRVEEITTESGDYEPPMPSEDWAAAELTLDEDYLFGRVGEATIVLGVADNFDIQLPEDAPTVCCSFYEVLPRTRPWWETDYAQIDYERELGDFVATLAPTLERYEAQDYDHTRSERPIEVDEDQLGFVLRSYYYVEPAGCADASCASTLRVVHHFRRP